MISDMSDFKIAKIIIKTPLWRDFDYIIPPDPQFTDIAIGCRVVAPFGKRKVVGVVADLLDHSELDPQKLKPLTDLLDQTPIYNESLLKLCSWASSYYHHPLGEVVFGVFPKKLRQLRAVPVPSTEHHMLSGDAMAADPLTLTQAQQHAIDAIDASADQFNCLLLHGVTGSGKTEVYLQAIAKCIARGQQALVLVPEISLTPQTVKRFQQRFKVPIAAMHSGLKDSERLHSWFAALQGEAPIIIGTRLAVFAPLKNLGMIIVDEEHDASFKQQSGFRYSARDVAIMRGYLQKIPVVLGSATPSLESLHNAWQDRYCYLSLPQRAGNAKPPKVQLIDIKQQSLKAGLSAELLAKMKQHLEQNGQVLLFLNRRGYAPVLMCHHCGATMQCRHCDAFLTYHQSQRKLQCHHCDFVTACPRVCNHCHQAELLPIGLGTERIEEELKQLFPEYQSLRIDRDTTRKKGALENLLEDAHNHRAHILVGTQMLAKGHHFSNLTLVAIVDADSGLYSTDFRGLERLAQLLIQVAGRAGREQALGEVLIQTHHPEHPMLQCLLQEGFTAFAKQLVEQRQAAQLPPCVHMAVFRSEAVDEVSAKNFLSQLKQRLLAHKAPSMTVLGPVESPMARRAGKFRAQLWLQTTHRQQLQQLLATTLQEDWLKRGKHKVHWSLDVDPVEFV